MKKWPDDAVCKGGVGCYSERGFKKHIRRYPAWIKYYERRLLPPSIHNSEMWAVPWEPYRKPKPRKRPPIYKGPR